MKKIILIPAYEPDNKLLDLLNKLKKTPFQIIVVDDGSGQKYQNIFQKAKETATVIQYEPNKGKGHALKEGMKYIKENIGEKYTVTTMDSDGQHTIKDAIKLEQYIEKHPNTLVTGMRKRNKETPLRSKIGNSITKLIYSVVTGITIYDTQTGLRSFSNELLDSFLNIEGERFEYEMNVLLYCAKNKIPLLEIPIETIYIQNNKGSHFKTLKDSYKIYKEIIKFSLSSISCFLIDYTLFIIISQITNKIILSNTISRIISSSTNYILNKKIVFKSHKKETNSLIQYILLVIIILASNNLILNLCTTKLSINKWIAKLITELILFIISWIIQKNFIFQSKKTNKKETI